MSDSPPRRFLSLRSGSPEFHSSSLSTVVEDDGPWPTDVGHRVSLERFLANDSKPAASIRLGPGDDVNRLADRLSQIEAIDVHFEAFTDGRGYSQAKVLRDQLHFEGEIRATGDVGADQVHYLREVGCDAFELREGTKEDAVLRALSRITVNYRDPKTRRGATAR